MAGDGFRLPGEFERQAAVWLCWSEHKYAARGHDVHDVYAEVVAHLVDEVQVYFNCGVEGTIDECRRVLARRGVELERIVFTQFADRFHWARDYGADIVVAEGGAPDRRSGSDAGWSRRRRLVNFGFDAYGMAGGHGLGGGYAECVADTRRIAAHQAVVMDCTDIVDSFLVSEGGNRESNGRGVMMTIADTEVRKRNPGWSQQQVEAEFVRLFGLDKVIWLPWPTWEDEDFLDGVLDVVDGRPVYRSHSANGHIDEMCRFVSEDTVVLAEVAAEDAKARHSARVTRWRLEAAREVLERSTTADGRPLRIVRIPTPEPIHFVAGPGDVIHETWQEARAVLAERGGGDGCGAAGDGLRLRDGTRFPSGDILMQPALSYCNFLICNGVVLGQKYWKEGLPDAVRLKDEAAHRVLVEAFPGRQVVMLDATALNILGGGIHCITKNVPWVPGEAEHSG